LEVFAMSGAKRASNRIEFCFLARLEDAEGRLASEDARVATVRELQIGGCAPQPGLPDPIAQRSLTPACTR
jgi:hypothetical protein